MTDTTPTPEQKPLCSICNTDSGCFHVAVLPTPEQDDEHLRESLLLVTGMCNGPFDFPHRCSAMHCNHCGLCDVSEDLIKVCNAYAERMVVEAEKRGRDNLASQIEDTIAEFGDQVPLVFTCIEQVIHGDGEREAQRWQ